MSLRFQASLGVHRLRLAATLGYEAGERAKPQPVEIEIRLFFKGLPDACHDESAPFVCYDKLCAALSGCVENREFRLIEYMARELLGVVRANIREQLGERALKDINVWLRLHKCVPPVPAMLGGATITLSDFPDGISAAEIL